MWIKQKKKLEEEEVDVVQYQFLHPHRILDKHMIAILDFLANQSTEKLLDGVKDLSWCRSAMLDYCDSRGLIDEFKSYWAEGESECKSLLLNYKSSGKKNRGTLREPCNALHSHNTVLACRAHGRFTHFT